MDPAKKLRETVLKTFFLKDSSVWGRILLFICSVSSFSLSSTRAYRASNMSLFFLVVALLFIFLFGVHFPLPQFRW